MVARAAALFEGAHSTRWHAAMLVAASCAVYLVGLTNPFTTWDDPLYVMNNHRVRDPRLQAFVDLWNPRAALNGDFVEFFPLRDSLYWALHRMFGLAPTQFHATQLLFHVATALLVWRLACALRFTPRAALLAGVLFALHPINVEAVSWIASLKDPLYTSTMLASVLAYIRWREADAGEAPQFWSGKAWLAAALVLMLVSLLCKSFAIVEPGLLIAWELSRAVRVNYRSILVGVAPFALLAMASTVLFFAIARANTVVLEIDGIDRVSRLATAAWCQARYVELLLVPVRMRILYIVPPITSVIDVRLLAVVALTVAVLLALVMAWRRDRRYVFLVAWYWITLFPVLNIIPFPALMADRYLYAPSVAFCVAIAGWLAASRTGLARFAIAGVIAVYALGTTQRVLQWSDEVGMWQEVNDDAPGHPMAMQGLAVALGARGEHAAAVELRKRVLAFDLDTVALAVAHKSMGKDLAALGRNEEAVAHVRTSVKLEPSVVGAWDLLSVLEARLGNIAEARAAADQALAVSPGTPGLLWNRAILRARSGDAAGAAEDAASAVVVDLNLCPNVKNWRAGFQSAYPAAAAAMAESTLSTCEDARKP
jgi:tetratricopeptide (TPR) repeat protein